MAFITRYLVLFSAFICLTGPVVAREPGRDHSPRFKPFAGITYNLHFLGDPYNDIDPSFSLSQFPGAEFGFTILPARDNGWRVDYRNTFLPELALYGIGKALKGTGQSVFDDVVDRTVNNGFLGRLDIGKRLTGAEHKALEAGIVVSDKVLLGTDLEIPIYITPPDKRVANTGFHFTPGLFAAYSQNTNSGGEFTVRLALMQSVFDLHQFGDNAIDHYTLPLFTEFDLKYQTAGGLFVRTGALLAASYTELPADSRIRLGIGYTFRK